MNSNVLIVVGILLLMLLLSGGLSNLPNLTRQEQHSEEQYQEQHTEERHTEEQHTEEPKPFSDELLGETINMEENSVTHEQELNMEEVESKSKVTSESVSKWAITGWNSDDKYALY